MQQQNTIDINSFAPKSELNLYGCYLDSGQCWQCSKFDSVSMADAYALHQGTNHTRLIPIPLYVPTFAEKIYLHEKLKCPVKINTDNSVSN